MWNFIIQNANLFEILRELTASSNNVEITKRHDKIQIFLLFYGFWVEINGNCFEFEWYRNFFDWYGDTSAGTIAGHLQSLTATTTNVTNDGDSSKAATNASGT